MPSNSDAVRKVLSDGDAFGFTLLAVLTDEFGPGVVNEDPLEIFLKIKDRWQVELDPWLENKWNAIVTAMVTDQLVFKGSLRAVP